MPLRVRSLFPQRVDPTYNNEAGNCPVQSAHAGVSRPALINMVTRSGEENGRSAVATASPAEITRNSELVDFEKLLGDLSAAFIRVSAEGVDAEIERWLRLIVLAMNIDRSTVVQVDHADGILRPTHQWARNSANITDYKVRRNPVEGFPWLTRNVLSGELVVISSVEHLPAEASKDQATFRRLRN